jgi:hypothetical protein
MFFDDYQRQFCFISGFLMSVFFGVGASTASAQSIEAYGPRAAGLALNNLTVGGRWGNVISYRFRARKSGELTAVRVYWIYSFNKPGYHAGHGGTFRVSVRADDNSSNHRPSEIVMASTHVTMKLCATASSRADGPCGQDGQLNQDGIRKTFEPIEFSRGVMIQKGKLYHVVFENIDPHPAKNWVGLDGMFHPTDVKKLFPSSAAADEWTALLRYGKSPWEPSQTTMPILSVMLDGGEPNRAMGGKEFGFGYVAVWRHSYNQFPPVSNHIYARQIFTLTASRTISTINLYMGSIGGEGAMYADFKDSANKVLRTVKIDSHSLPRLATCPWRNFYGSVPAANESCSIWVKRALTQPLHLKAGQQYSIVLRSGGQATFGVNLLEKGLFYGFGKETVLSQAFSDMSYNAGKTWQPWTIWNVERSDADLQFSLE